MDVILDTCALLSLAGVVDKPLGKKTLQAIEDADSVYVSSSSCFELCLKYKRGNLKFPKNLKPESFWAQCIEHYNLTEVPVSSADFSDAVQLPDHHADPFDRIIIAQSMNLKSVIVTYDRLFKAYRTKLMN